MSASIPTRHLHPLDGAETAALRHCAPPVGGHISFDADGELAGAVALAKRKIAKAIKEASAQRRRAAVMLIHFAPRCSCDGTAPCWDLGLADFLARSGSRSGEWGPLRLDATTLVMVVQGFEDSNHVHRRATDVLNTLKTGWCRAGHEQVLVCAIGIGLFPEDGDTAESLLTHAEEALCDLLAIGHNASSFSLRRTLRPPA